jgi:hypothetical protein
MRKLIMAGVAAAGMVLGIATAQAAPTISLTGGALLNDTANDFANWLGGSGSSALLWEGGTISISDATFVRIQYFGKEASFDNHEFWWGTLGPYGTGTKIASTGPGQPNTVPLPIPALPFFPLSTTLISGVTSGKLPFYFGITAPEAAPPAVPRIVENGHVDPGNTDANAFYFGRNADGSLRTSGTSVWVLLDDGGGGQDNDHDDMVIRLTAEIPEPSTYLLLLAGLGLLGFMARRRMQG